MLGPPVAPETKQRADWPQKRSGETHTHDAPHGAEGGKYCDSGKMRVKSSGQEWYLFLGLWPSGEVLLARFCEAAWLLPAVRVL